MLVYYFRGHAFVVYLRTIKVHNDSVFKELTVHFLLKKSRLWNPPMPSVDPSKILIGSCLRSCLRSLQDLIRILFKILFKILKDPVGSYLISYRILQDLKGSCRILHRILNSTPVNLKDLIQDPTKYVGSCTGSYKDPTGS